MNCPYCHARMEVTDSAVIYHGHSYGNVWLCSNWPDCDVFVGCHKGTDTPLGIPANRILREWRTRCHSAFDRLWKSGRMKRKEAYAWMAQSLGIPLEQAHIAMLTLDQCQQLWKALRA